LILAAGLGAVLHRRRLWTFSLALSVILVVSFAVLPVANWLAVPLETRFATTPLLPDHVDGIIVLGGTERVERAAAWGTPELSDPEPIAAFIQLARRYPDARLVFSGGQHSRNEDGISEATIVRGFIAQLDPSLRTVIYEDKSRNTRENAEFAYDLIKPKVGEIWILITEAISMPRAVGAFRKLGWTVIPLPAGHATTGSFGDIVSFDLLGGLGLAEIAIHEWVGLFVYRFLGYTDEVFPR
jgi:uncharacterized SAM-binding protein YcdF (DUF218 family)